MAGEFLKEINKENVILDLSILEKKCSQEDFWLIELIKKELPAATDNLLGYFSEILEQEIQTKEDEEKNGWFRAPDESFELEKRFAEIYECAKTLREYKINLDALVISDNGCKYQVSKLIEKAGTLDAGLFEKLYLSIKKETKKAEVMADVRKIRQENECEYREFQEGCSIFGNEEKGNPEDELPFIDAEEVLEEIIEETVAAQGIFSTKDIEKEFWGSSREEIYQKSEEARKKPERPEYWKVEVARPELYFNKIPAVINIGRFNRFELSNKEKETLKMVDGKKTIKEILEKSSMKPEDALNLIVYMGKQGVLGHKQK